MRDTQDSSMKMFYFRALLERFSVSNSDRFQFRINLTYAEIVHFQELITVHFVTEISMEDAAFEKLQSPAVQRRGREIQSAFKSAGRASHFGERALAIS